MVSSELFIKILVSVSPQSLSLRWLSSCPYTIEHNFIPYTENIASDS